VRQKIPWRGDPLRVMEFLGRHRAAKYLRSIFCFGSPPAGYLLSLGTRTTAAFRGRMERSVRKPYRPWAGGRFAHNPIDLLTVGHFPL
jgi:hypothetical protein